MTLSEEKSGPIWTSPGWSGFVPPKGVTIHLTPRRTMADTKLLLLQTLVESLRDADVDPVDAVGVLQQVCGFETYDEAWKAYISATVPASTLAENGFFDTMSPVPTKADKDLAAAIALMYDKDADDAGSVAAAVSGASGSGAPAASKKRRRVAAGAAGAAGATGATEAAPRPSKAVKQTSAAAAPAAAAMEAPAACGVMLLPGMRCRCRQCAAARLAPAAAKPSAAPTPSAAPSAPVTTPTCSICLEACDGHNQKKPVRALKCAHVFHTSCINTWAKVKKECPVCKEKL